MKIKLAEQIRCARRELAMRVSFYPNLIKSGRMREDQAQREIDTMQAILDTLEGLERGENVTRDVLQSRIEFE